MEIATGSEIESFANAIGAQKMSPQPGQEQLFRSGRNYLQLPLLKLVVKISRLKRSFWGVGVPQIQALEEFGPYYLVLLITERSGWALSRAEIKKLRLGPKSACWSRGTTGHKNENEYKINLPLPDQNMFQSIEQFLQVIDASPEGRAATRVLR
jgi:hypothetical protein